MTSLSSSINLIEYAGRPWSDIKFTEIDGNIKKTTGSKNYHATRLLPREEFPFYGQFPKLETKILLECDKCGRVVLPCVFASHCKTPEHVNAQHNILPSSMPTRSSTAYRTRKSTTNPSTIFASASNTNYNNTVKVVNPLPGVAVVSTAAVVAPSTATLASFPSSSKSKKSAKSNKRRRKDEKSDKVTTISASATATVQSSETQPKKIVKIDHQGDHVVATITNIPIVSSKPSSVAVPVAVHVSNTHIERTETRTKEEIKESVTTTSTHATPRTAFIKIATAPSKAQPTTSTNVISINKKKVEVLQPTHEAAVTPITVSNKPQGYQESSSSVVHMPMSPVAVVNIVPVQYLQQYLQLPTQPFVVRIPCTNANTHMYSYPKPLTVTTRALRKIGSTYLLQNQRIDHQRTEIQAITRSRCAFSNSTTLNHLPT